MPLVLMSYISIKQILDNLLVHPLLSDLSLERAVMYTIEFINIVGSPQLYEDKVEEVAIENYRGLLPCDCVNVTQVRDASTKNVYVYSSSNFPINAQSDYKSLCYKIQGNVILTSTKDNTLEVSYKSVAVDEEGYPLILDISAFTRALELYIKKQWFTIQFDLGKIHGAVLQNVQQEYAWAVGQCQAKLIMPSLDQMESITRTWNTLVPKVKEHSKGFHK